MDKLRQERLDNAPLKGLELIFKQAERGLHNDGDGDDSDQQKF